MLVSLVPIVVYAYSVNEIYMIVSKIAVYGSSHVYFYMVRHMFICNAFKLTRLWVLYNAQLLQ